MHTHTSNGTEDIIIILVGGWIIGPMQKTGSSVCFSAPTLCFAQKQGVSKFLWEYTYPETAKHIQVISLATVARRKHMTDGEEDER